jgi:hypothetical protein
MNRNEFVTAMIPLQKYFGKNLEPEVFELYWMRLGKITVEIFNKMTANLIDTYRSTSQNPFPLISDFLSAVGLSGENRAQAAVTAVKNAVEKWGAWYSVDFGDPALHAVINRFGGWPEICSWGNSGQWQYNEKKFIDAYESAVSCGESSSPVEGNFEIGNRDKDQTIWNQTMKISYNRAIEPKKIPWIGSDFSIQIEYKKQNQKLITKEPQNIKDILNI